MRRKAPRITLPRAGSGRVPADRAGNRLGTSSVGDRVSSSVISRLVQRAIGIGDAEAGEDLHFQRFHHRCGVVTLVVVAKQMQDTMNHQMP